MNWKTRAKVTVAIAAAVIATTTTVLPLAQAQAGVTRQSVAIPAYWGPNTAPGMAMFQRLAQNGPTNDLVVVNGSKSKAEAPFNSAWATAIKKLHDSGVKTITYVDTGYLGVDFGQPGGGHKTRDGQTTIPAWLNQIRADIDEWYTLYGQYGVDGIFLDQAISSCGLNNAYVNHYLALQDYLKTKYPNAYLIINPGESPEQCYENAADTIMSMERDMTYYMSYTPPAWQLNHPNPKKFWHAVYAVPTKSDMETVMARSKANNAGYIYITERPLIPFPWDTIAAYWDAELVKASGITDTSPPAKPSQLTGSGRSGPVSSRANLNWKTPTDNVAVADYEIFRDGVSLGRSYNNAYTVTGLLPSTSYTFTVKATDGSGNVSAASTPLVLTTPVAGTALADAATCLSPTTAKYQVTYNESYTHHRVFIDADNNPGTGWNLPPGQPQGVDYMIENDRLLKYTGPDWYWEPVAGVAPLVSDTDGKYSWQIPASALGGDAATTQQLVFNGFDLGGAAPEAYSQPLTVTQTPAC